MLTSLLLMGPISVACWSFPRSIERKSVHVPVHARIGRRTLFGGAVVAVGGLLESTTPGTALAIAAAAKQTNLSDNELGAAVAADIRERQFLVTGDITRSLFDEGATFKDEIDTYTMDKWISGTKKLFGNSYSHIDLIGDVRVEASRVEFRFSERLQFNIPLLNPKVDLSGTVELKRGPDGLITEYVEHWDQPVGEVLSKIQIFK